MVLTQQGTLSRIRGRWTVSIPLWFSRNQEKREKALQSSKGFHTTMVLTQRNFDRRGVAMMLRFHTTMVLTQPSRLSGKSTAFWPFPYHYGSHATGLLCEELQDILVSIPLWFSRNGYISTTLVNGTKFPYHYGSHATFGLELGYVGFV